MTGPLHERLAFSFVTEALEAGLPASSAAETEPAVIFAARWANLFAGQLAEWPED